MSKKTASDRNKRTEKPAQLALAGVQAAAAGPLPRLAYTLKEVAAILGISYISVYRLTKKRDAGDRPLLKVSLALPGRALVPAREIESFLTRTAQ